MRQKNIPIFVLMSLCAFAFAFTSSSIFANVIKRVYVRVKERRSGKEINKERGRIMFDVLLVTPYYVYMCPTI